MEMHIPHTVIIADDHPLLIHLYRQYLESKGFQIVAECSTPTEVVEKYKELKPNVVLLDVRFGEQATGFDALKEILDCDPKANVVMISQFELGPYIARAYKLGARAFLHKACVLETMLAAVIAAVDGQRYIVPELSVKVVEQMSDPDPDPMTLLNPVDFQIFIKLAEGRTNNEIAAEMGLPISFVSSHRQKIQDILKIDRGQQFSHMALALGLIKPRLKWN